MTRRLFAALTAAALMLCVGRAAAWASPSARAHACCQLPKGKAAPAAVTDCCPIAAATISPRLAPASAPAAFFSRAPERIDSVVFVGVAVPSPAPPDFRASRPTPPARAPPLA